MQEPRGTFNRQQRVRSSVAVLATALVFLAGWPVAAATGDCAAVVGFVDATRDLYNAAAVCAHGEVRATYHKRELPNYAVFDEQRYFARGEMTPSLVLVGGVRVGVSICEDAFNPVGPIAAQAAGGAELVININASRK